MVVHKTWYTTLATLLGFLFIATSLAILFAPQVMLSSILAAFEVDQSNLAPLHLAMVGNCMRNFVIGAFIIYFAFKNTKFLVVLLTMRLFIEGLDLIGGLIWNPEMAAQLPVFAVIMGLEAFLLVKGIACLKQHDGKLEVAARPAV